VILHIPHTEPLSELPAHPDGDDWAYALADGTGLWLSDDTGSLVAVAIPGYPGRGPDDSEEALTARYETLVEMGDRAQRWMLEEAVRTGRIDLATVDEDSLNALVTSTGVPFEPSEGNGPAVWSNPVPLVAIVTDYQPFTSRPAPLGRVVWLDPSDELSILTSLHDLGLVVLTVRSAG